MRPVSPSSLPSHSHIPIPAPAPAPAIIAPGRRVTEHISPARPHIASVAEYQERHAASLQDPDAFWGAMARDLLTWRRPFTTVLTGDFATGHARWFEDGLLNVAENCVDRHATATPDRVALLWEADEPGVNRRITYAELLVHVSRVAALMQGDLLQLRKGDTVTIYMPMIPETVFVMLACARLGLVHNVVFAGFSAEALCDRIVDAQSRVIFAADFGHRGGRKIPLGTVVKEALAKVKAAGHDTLVQRVILLERDASHDDSGKDTAHAGNRAFISWTEAMRTVHDVSFTAAVDVASEDPLFMLYTSGSTGKPKGLLHTSAGYLTYAALTTRLSFDLHPELGDVMGCLADVGWITGHSYIVYGPLALGATTVLFESLPTHPNPSRYWDTAERLAITQLYTAPTVIRALRRFGESPVQPFPLAKLRVLGSVGEPINADAWLWYHRVVGREECSVVDTFWQTETGGHVIAPLPAVHAVKPGAAGFPCLGIDVALLDPVTGRELTDNDVDGVLVIKRPWPGLARTIFGDHDRFFRTYFHPYPGCYFTGDGAHRDRDGHIWIRGRVDDVINVSGHRLSTAEIEAVLGRHPRCAEAAVLGRPDDITGQSIWAFCILKDTDGDSTATGPDTDASLVTIQQEMTRLVREGIGALAAPRFIILPSDLPKTRSGKIMRRLLRKILAGEGDQLGDLSTLNNPAVIDEIKRLVHEADLQLAAGRK